MKDLLTLDFETFYGDDFTLSKMTTEAYIRDPRFETIMMGYKLGNDRTHYIVGHGPIQIWLDAADVSNRPVLAHHSHFDGLILSHHFGHTPKLWFDTLSMARALHGSEVGGSLSKLMLHYGVGEKGTEIIMAKGKHLADFSPSELAAYGGYCMKDVQGTYDIFERMVGSFSKSELKLIDMVTRMFTEPALLLDEEMLRDYAMSLQANKLTLLLEAGVTLEEVMSADKFAKALERAGVVPPQKVSPTTGKVAFAFAKTDKGLIDLAEHPDDRVQALVAARLGNKSTINESRANRMAEMAPRGPAPMYFKYSGAQQTHRLSGGDSMNWQNMQRGGTLRDAIYAPDGQEIMVVDSKNIEARVLDWLAMQEDAIAVYRAADAGTGPDVYCVMAERLYRRPITPADKDERQLGKVVKLACGYQMGAERFRETARTMGGLTIDMNTATTVVNVYRDTHPMVTALWNRAQNALGVLMGGAADEKHLDPHGLLEVEQGAIKLPNGLQIRYPELSFDTATKWSFRSNRGERTNLYGGKVIENVVQALARIIVLEQTLEIHKHTPCRMSVHDEGVFLIPEGAGKEWLEYATGVMSIPPSWAPDLPVAASGAVGKRYGEAK